VELESSVSMPVARRTCRPVMFEVLSASDDLVHLIAEDDFDHGIAAGDGQYLAVSGERITAHATTADSERRCPACRATLRRNGSAARHASGARQGGRHRQRCRPKSMVTCLIGVLVFCSVIFSEFVAVQAFGPHIVEVSANARGTDQEGAQ
jgi:hypothetical protein